MRNIFSIGWTDNHDTPSGLAMVYGRWRYNHYTLSGLGIISAQPLRDHFTIVIEICIECINRNPVGVA